MSFKLGEKDAIHQSQELESSLLSSLQVCWIPGPCSHVEMETVLQMETSCSDLHQSGGFSMAAYVLPFSFQVLVPSTYPPGSFSGLWVTSQDLWKALWFLKALPSWVIRGRTYPSISQSAYGLNKGDGPMSCKRHSICTGAVQRSLPSFSRGKW